MDWLTHLGVVPMKIVNPVTKLKNSENETIREIETVWDIPEDFEEMLATWFTGNGDRVYNMVMKSAYVDFRAHVKNFLKLNGDDRMTDEQIMDKYNPEFTPAGMGRDKKTPEEKILATAEKLGVSKEELLEMLS